MQKIMLFTLLMLMINSEIYSVNINFVTDGSDKGFVDTIYTLTPKSESTTLSSLSQIPIQITNLAPLGLIAMSSNGISINFGEGNYTAPRGYEINIPQTNTTFYISNCKKMGNFPACTVTQVTCLNDNFNCGVNGVSCTGGKTCSFCPIGGSRASNKTIPCINSKGQSTTYVTNASYAYQCTVGGKCPKASN